MNRQRLRAFLLGGAVGALAGILLAPRSGRELWGSIADRAGDARERSRESYFQAQERMQERFSEGFAGTRENPRGTTTPENEVFAGPADASTQPAPETATRLPLRDVSWNAQRADEREPTGESAGDSAEVQEELRRRVRETRARLRARLDEPTSPEGDRGE